MPITNGVRHNPKKTTGTARCSECHLSFALRRYWQRFCSYKCQYTNANRARQAAVEAIPRKVTACLRCGTDLSHKKSHAIYCSKTCKSMDHTFKHRGKTRFANTARRLLIFQRDNGACYMCGTAVTLKEMELDHLIPVKKGGSSESSNLAVSCRWCNRSKGAKVSGMQNLKIADLSWR